jgi:hypothetical protein
VRIPSPTRRSASAARTRSQLGGSVDAAGAATLDLAAVDPMMIFQTLMPKVFSPIS